MKFPSSCSIDLKQYQSDVTHDLTLSLHSPGTLSLHDSPGTIHLLLVISGIHGREKGSEDAEETMETAKSVYVSERSHAYV